MAITDKKQGVWELDEVYNKQNEGGIWTNNRSGLLYMWGNWWGLSPTYRFSSPVQIAGTTWEKSRGGYYAVLFKKTDGTLWGMGYNSGSGNLGQNNRLEYVSPPVSIGTDTTWNKFAVGRGYTAATKTDGTLWTWGKNEGGQLGQNEQDGDLTQKSSPTQVGTNTTWNYITTADSCMAATKTDNTLWIWGRNNDGELGLNNKVWPSSPTQIPGTTWSGPVGHCKNQTFFCIRTDGTLWGWGENEFAQLGLNAVAHNYYSSPMQIGTDTTWNILQHGGGDEMRAIKTDNTLWAWGINENGQLGLNDTTNYSSPKQLTGTWSSFATARQSCAAIKTDGTLWSWGKSTAGQLGLNQPETTRYSSPVQIPGIYGNIGAVKDVDGGGYFGIINE